MAQNSLIEVQNVICECQDIYRDDNDRLTVALDYDVNGEMRITHPCDGRLTTAFKSGRKYLFVVYEIRPEEK